MSQTSTHDAINISVSFRNVHFTFGAGKVEKTKQNLKLKISVFSGYVLTQQSFSGKVYTLLCFSSFIVKGIKQKSKNHGLECLSSK